MRAQEKEPNKRNERTTPTETEGMNSNPSTTTTDTTRLAHALRALSDDDLIALSEGNLKAMTTQGLEGVAGIWSGAPKSRESKVSAPESASQAEVLAYAQSHHAGKLRGSFDAAGARRAGYSDREIADYLAGKGNFDAEGARKAGYSDAEIVAHLSAPQAGPKPPRNEGNATQWKPEAPTGYLDALGKIQAGIAHNVANKLQDLPVVGPLYRGGREVAEGVTQGIAHIGERLGITSPETVERVDSSLQDSKREYEKTPGIWRKYGPIAGGVAATWPLLPAGGAANLATKAVKGAAAGAGYSVMQPVTEGDYWKGKQDQAKTGAVFGAAAAPVGHVVSKVIAPKVSESVKRLQAAGVPLTPGQIMGGTARRVEESLKSMPLVGDAIAAAENRGLHGFNVAAINKALYSIGESLPKTMKPGYHAITHAGERISKAYDEILPKLTLTTDKALTAEIQGIRRAALNMGPKNEQFERILQSEVLDKFNAGRMTGETMKRVESQLGYYIRKFQRSQDPADMFMFDALRDTQNALRKALERSNPEARARLKAINRSFAEFMRVERAASMQGAKEGIFTPNQLESAVRALDSSGRKRSFARGKALMQDLATDAGSVITPKLNNSGTADRLLLNAAALGGGAYVSPAALAGGLLAAGAYTSPAQRVLGAALTKRPAGAGLLAEGIERAAPVAGPALANR